MLLPLNDRKDLLPFVHKLIEKCTEPYWLAQEKISPSVCVGISMCPDDSSQFGALIQHAEAAMFEAKQQGVPFRVYHQDMHSALTQRLEIEQGLRRALEHNLLNVVLQPKYNLLEGKTIGYEALVRWHDANLGTVAPDIFVAVAEAVNLGKQLDRWVIDTVLQQLSLWQKAGLQPPPVAVNITSKHFSDPELFNHIMTKLQELRLVPSSLQLEITEGVAMDKSPTTLINLNAFRSAGIKIAIDDFGTGYSSLSYLTSLPIDFIKIDKAFVQALESDHNLSLVKAMLAMAKAITVQVIAEGIETHAQQQLLASLGCDFGQGYLYAKPTSLADIEQQLISVN